jgi:predicted protein tyrosine phosphatase
MIKSIEHTGIWQVVRFLENMRAEDAENYALISIRESSVDLSEDDFPYHVLNEYKTHIIQFDDIDRPDDILRLFEYQVGMGIFEFSQYLNELPESLHLIVHCHAGVSRSAAIVRALAQFYELPYNEKYDLYNKHVYREMCNVISDELS